MATVRITRETRNKGRGEGQTSKKKSFMSGKKARPAHTKGKNRIAAGRSSTGDAKQTPQQKKKDLRKIKFGFCCAAKKVPQGQQKGGRKPSTKPVRRPQCGERKATDGERPPGTFWKREKMQNDQSVPWTAGGCLGQEKKGTLVSKNRLKKGQVRRAAERESACRIRVGKRKKS